MPAQDSDSAQLRTRKWRAHAALFLMAVIWAVNFSVAKIALRALSPLAFNALRFPMAALALFLLLRTHGPIQLPAPEDRLRVLGLGLLGNAIYQMGFIFGLDHTRAGTASVLLAGTPLMTALLSARLGHERVSIRVLVGVFCTLAGIALVVWFDPRGEAGAQSSYLGPLLLLGASMSWAVYTVGSRRLVDRYGPLAVTFWTLTVGAAILFLIGLPSVSRTDLSALPLEMWLAIVYAGVLSIALAYLIWYNGVAVLGNTRTATYSNLVPVLTLGVAWLWLAEVPHPGQVVGAFVIIAGVSLAQIRGAQAQTSISSPG
ncbi:MAG TPA: DMT family transporter [Longimicrobiales bacterium]|nr:DMT family transporter [Longimicrobiales bacterium]